jgi:2-polyprenyl-3-methyl-5-hydroxy-6-metoxy-1,4-benzoquinol methylase
MWATAFAVWRIDRRVIDVGSIVTSVDYNTKHPNYFGFARTEVFPLLPDRMDRVLELGCGSGATLAALKAADRCRWTAGLELVESAASEARKQVDEVHVGNFEHMDLGAKFEPFDAILCLDVLEHLVDPWTAVRRLGALLRPGGALVASIPNVRNVRVVLPLVLFGRWRYEEQGQLDRTHLRFFTRETAIELVGCGGLAVDRVETVVGQRGQLVNRLTFGALRRFFDFQYLVRGTRRA